MSPEQVVFEESLEFTLAWEGGYVNHPDDPGGATNKGITQKVYDAYREKRGEPPEPVLEITNDAVEAIYLNQYWKPSGCDEIATFSPSVAMCQFDAAVNVGVHRATKWLQSVVRADRDGVYGPLTHEQFTIALDQVGEDEVVDQLIAKRESWYAYLRDRPDANFGVFYQGWINRVNALREELGVA
jgi:lysozyme family protein